MVRLMKTTGEDLLFPTATDFAFNQFGMAVVQRKSNIRSITGEPAAPEVVAVVNMNNVVALLVETGTEVN